MKMALQPQFTSLMRLLKYLDVIDLDPNRNVIYVAPSAGVYVITYSGGTLQVNGNTVAVAINPMTGSLNGGTYVVQAQHMVRLNSGDAISADMCPVSVHKLY